jgi:hypothetical protein
VPVADLTVRLMSSVFSSARRGKTPPIWLIGAVLATTLASSAVVAATRHEELGHTGAAITQPTVTGSLTIDRAHPSGSLSPTALGLSFEADQLSLLPGFDPDHGNIKNLLRNLGTGYLKVGANAVDDFVYWNPTGQTPPTWAKTSLTPVEIDRLAKLSTASGWPVELAVNLAHLDPAAIADEARYATTRLGPNLVAMECGNEPNGYAGRVRAATYGYKQYKPEFNSCAQALNGAGARIAGPNTYNGAWLGEFARDEHARISMLTAQPYALSQKPGVDPTVVDLLSPDAAQSALSALAGPLATAGQYGLPLRYDETNSVNMGGLHTVSDVYGAALWTADTILLLTQHGVAGLNFHGTLGRCDQPEADGRPRYYTPLCAATVDDETAGVLKARPVYYGMLMVALMGAGDFLPVTIKTGHNITSYAVRGKDGHTRIMVIDKESVSSGVETLSLGGFPTGTTAQVTRLTGDALDSASGVEINGASVGRDGSFKPGPAQPLTAGRQGFTVTVPTGSATLITVNG